MRQNLQNNPTPSEDLQKAIFRSGKQKNHNMAFENMATKQFDIFSTILQEPYFSKPMNFNGTHPHWVSSRQN